MTPAVDLTLFLVPEPRKGSRLLVVSGSLVKEESAQFRRLGTTGFAGKSTSEPGWSRTAETNLLGNKARNAPVALVVRRQQLADLLQ